jgi:hypothetical protein
MEVLQMTQQQLANELMISRQTLVRFIKENDLNWKKDGHKRIRDLYNTRNVRPDLLKNEDKRKERVKEQQITKIKEDVQEIEEITPALNVTEMFFDIIGNEKEQETRKNINTLKKRLYFIQKMINNENDDYELIKLIDREQKIIKDIDVLIKTLNNISSEEKETSTFEQMLNKFK